jgi:hypothetical protein
LRKVQYGMKPSAFSMLRRRLRKFYDELAGGG